MSDAIVAVILDERASVIAEPPVHWAQGELRRALAERDLGPVSRCFLSCVGAGDPVSNVGAQ